MYCIAALNSFAIWALRAAGNDRSGIGSPGSVARATLAKSPDSARRSGGSALLTPAEAGLARHRVHRARRHALRHRRVVVALGCGVVGGVRMEQRGQVLDLATADLQLALPAAVDRDAVRPAVLVDREQLPQRAEARRLRVDGLASVLLDVVERVQVGVPGDSVGVRLEHGLGLVVEVRVLEVGLGKGLR